MRDPGNAIVPADPTPCPAARQNDLPEPGLERWTPGGKAAVVAAVNDGALTVNEACDRYHMTAEEFSAWDRALHNFGIIGRG